jgi:uncharacterized protein (TIGR03437 family)
MDRIRLSLMLLCVYAVLGAQNPATPELGLDVNGRPEAVVSRGWPLLIRVAVVCSDPDGQTLRIGVSGGDWTKALRLSIANAGGVPQNWPVQLAGTLSSTLSLSGIASADAVWLVAPTATSAIPTGLYNLSATLDTTVGAAAGTWSGKVSANTSTLRLQDEPTTLSPEDETAKYLAFEAYSRYRGDASGARTALDTLLTRQPAAIQGYVEKADLLSAAGDYQGALELAQQALDKAQALDPNPQEPPIFITLRIGDLASKLASKQVAGGGLVVTSVEPGSTQTILAPDSIAVGYGERLATSTVVASGALSTTLGGTTVTIKDSKGQSVLAPLFYVSPGQVDYQVPATVALGPATVRIQAQDGATSTGLDSIALVQPGVFTLNADGLVAANVLRVPTGGGTPVFEDVFTIDAAGNVVARPVDVSTGQAFLVLYGTGIRGAASGKVSVLVGDVQATVAYAGPQGTYIGLDQVNVQLPPTLAGRGDVPIVLTAAGKRANVTRITIRP